MMILINDGHTRITLFNIQSHFITENVSLIELQIKFIYFFSLLYFLNMLMVHKQSLIISWRFINIE